MRTKIPAIAAAVALLLAAGCATSPDDEAPEDDGLLASTSIVHRYPVEEGKVIEVGRFSQLHPGGPLAEKWEPYVLQPSNPLTQYRPVEVAGNVCVEADATNGHS